MSTGEGICVGVGVGCVCTHACMCMWVWVWLCTCTHFSGIAISCLSLPIRMLRNLGGREVRTQGVLVNTGTRKRKDQKDRDTKAPRLASKRRRTECVYRCHLSATLPYLVFLFSPHEQPDPHFLYRSSLCLWEE